MAFVKLIQLGRCGAGRGTFVEHAGRELGVFRIDGADDILVVDNSCPHAGANLSCGNLNGSVITCPWHGWEFDLRTGMCVHSDKAKVSRYPVELREGFVYADLDAPF